MKKSNILTYVIAITMIFTFANFNSAQTQRESQLGTLCKQFRDYNDCKEYLKDYPNGNTASFAKSIVDDHEASSNTNSGGNTVEDQYWDAVKNSTNADDYKRYLTEYPNGKYASLARRKINGGSSPNSLFTFKVTTAMTNEAYMERLENHMISQLPIKIGEYEIYRAKAPSSLEDYFYTSVRATKSGPPANLGRQISPLKAQLTPDYCKSELAQRKITMAFSWDGTNFSEQFRPSDCSTNTTSAKQTDVEYLNSWAAEVRVDLPEMIGDFQLTDARSKCPVGCNQNGSSNHLGLTFNALNEQKDAPIDQLKNSLTSLLSEVYCKSEAIPRKISLGIFFENRGEKADFLNTWIHPEACSAKTIAIQGKTVFITSVAYDGNLGGVSGANATCQMHARNAGLSGTFKAWLGDNRTNPWTSFNQSILPYIMPNGAQIAANWQALLASNLETKFDVDEYGKTQLNAGAWTGFREERVEKTCNNWTSNDSGQSGTHGCSSTTDSRWGRTPCGVNRCDLKYRLYCVQQ